MSGWKSKAAGFGSILWGLGEVLLAFANPELGTTVEGGFEKVVGGLAVLGLAHKIEKAAVKV